ncbi:hypothetical protein ACIGBL_33390 [Streptomyces sp. NPDC085614]|uniref:hypothetical protein n=1 Tax=Streptomyces sp. NPDC085614 TaxID=3365733 RepID=UPI0037D6A60D
MAAEDYVWTRRDDESSRAYEAFREYMRLRSTPKVAESLGRTMALIGRWCTAHDWVARTLAYDQHMARAETDGYASQIASVRDKHIDLADKLLDHLGDRLEDFITERIDPTVRWTQAFTAAVKAQQGAFQMRDQDRTSELLTTAMDLLARLDDADKGAP